MGGGGDMLILMLIGGLRKFINSPDVDYRYCLSIDRKFIKPALRFNHNLF